MASDIKHIGDTVQQTQQNGLQQNGLQQNGLQQKETKQKEINYLEKFIENLNSNKEIYLQKIYHKSFQQEEREPEEAREFTCQILVEVFIPWQTKLYASMDKDDVEAIAALLKEKHALLYQWDLINPDEQQKLNPLFYCVTLLDNAANEEEFSKRLKILRLMLNHPSTELLLHGENNKDKIAKQRASFEMFFYQQNLESFDSQESSFLRFLINYKFKRKNLRKMILVEVGSGERAKQFIQCLQDTSPNSLLTLALESSDAESVAYLVSQGAKIEEDHDSLGKYFKFALLVIFEQQIDKYTSVALIKAILPAIRGLSGDQRELFKTVFFVETPTERSRYHKSVLLPAIKNGHFLSLLMLIDALKLDETSIPFFKEKSVLTVVGDSIASDEDISAFIDYIFAIRCDSKEGWEVSAVNENFKICSITSTLVDNELQMSYDEQSCLHNLAANSKLKTLEKFLALGANPNCVTKADSLLHLAAKKQNLALVRLLLRFIEDPTELNALNSEGVTALDLAYHHSSIREVLLAAGATDVQRQTYRLPEAPIESLANLHLEEKLRLEQQPKLSNRQKYRLIDNQCWFSNTVKVPVAASNVLVDEDAVESFKSQHPELYHFIGNRVPHKLIQLVVIHKIDPRTKVIANQFLCAIDACGKIIRESYKRVLDEMPRYYRGYRVKTHQKEIPDLLKRHDGRVIIETKWFSEYQYLRVFNELSAAQKESITQLNSILREQESSLMALWTQLMSVLKSFKMELQYLQNIKLINTYTKQMGYDDKDSLIFSSPPHLLLGREVCCFEKIPKEVLADWGKNLEDVQHIIARNKLGWGFLHKQMQPKRLNNYLSRYPKKKVTIGKHTLEFVDLTEADDYRFLVNTIITKSERLRELRTGDPAFFNSTPFISACFIDPVTRAFKGGHQKNPLGFPVYLALDVPCAPPNPVPKYERKKTEDVATDPSTKVATVPSMKDAATVTSTPAKTEGLAFSDPICYVGPVDLGTPWGEAGAPVTKIEFLRKAIRTREITGVRRALYQAKFVGTDPKQMTAPYPSAIQTALDRDEMYYRKPVLLQNESAKDMGKLPLLGTDELLRSTCLDPTLPNAYSECIVMGNTFSEQKAKMEGRLLIVEKCFLDQFKEKGYAAVAQADSKDVEESLSILSSIEADTNGRLRLVLINTKLNGYKEKRSVLRQLEDLEAEKPAVLHRLEMCDAREQRYRLKGDPIRKGDFLRKGDSVGKGDHIPKWLAEEMAVAKANFDALVQRQAYLVALAKDPPLLTQQAKNKAAAPLLLSAGPSGVVSSDVVPSGVVPPGVMIAPEATPQRIALSLGTGSVEDNNGQINSQTSGDRPAPEFTDHCYR